MSPSTTVSHYTDIDKANNHPQAQVIPLDYYVDIDDGDWIIRYFIN